MRQLRVPRLCLERLGQRICLRFSNTTTRRRRFGRLAQCPANHGQAGAWAMFLREGEMITTQEVDMLFQWTGS